MVFHLKQGEQGEKCICHADPTVQPHVRLTQQVLLIKFDYTLLLIIRCLLIFERPL